jgi:hypothetical protein
MTRYSAAFVSNPAPGTSGMPGFRRQASTTLRLGWHAAHGVIEARHKQPNPIVSRCAVETESGPGPN